MKADQITAEVKTFPGMPAAAVKLLALMDSPEVTSQAIETILRRDPALTANLLKLANSAYLGLPAKVGSIRQALMLLGFKRLMQMVIATCTSTIMDRPVPGYDLSAGELWRHSIAVSVAAEGLVRELGIQASDEIFTAALLHDIGKLVLGQFVREDYRKLELALEQGLSFETAESIVLGTDHAEIGAQVLAKWSFPQEIVNAVRFHHAPERTDVASAMLDVVHVANMLCLMIGIGVGREGLHYAPSAAVTERLGIKPQHLEKVASQTLQWANDLEGALKG
jgi:putative nucleotidyltransferase with HDIG domain